MLPPTFPLPSALATLAWIRRPIQVMHYCRARFGHTFAIRLAGTGNVVLTADPESIKRIFTGDPHELRAGEVNVVLEPLVGSNSVLLLDGAQHLAHRRLLLPPFHGERMRLYADDMQRATRAQMARWPQGEAFALREPMQAITLEVILRTVFGVDPEKLVALRSGLERMLAIADSPGAILTMLPTLRHDLPFSPWRRFLADRARNDAELFALIDRRRAETREGKTDILSMLIDAVDVDGRPLSNQELRDELVTLLVAGHETTATALAWAFERILATPEVYTRLRAELREREHGPEELTKLPYLDATVHESLRTRPVIPMVGRRLHAPFEVGGFQIPPGWVVAPSIYLTQQSPRLYSEPEKFSPERFLDKRPDPYTWFPFGGGIRRCLGMAFALVEMKIVLGTVLSEIDLTLAERPPVRTVRRAITFVPEGGTRVRARRAA